MRFEKGRLALVAALIGAALLILNVPAHVQAQSLSMRATIPFDFQVGDIKLPAGTYFVHRTGDALQISDGNGHSVFAISNAVPNPAARLDSQLVFSCYGDVRFLKEVRWNGYSNGREVPKSSGEIELAKLNGNPTVLTASITR